MHCTLRMTTAQRASLRSQVGAFCSTCCCPPNSHDHHNPQWCLWFARHRVCIRVTVVASYNVAASTFARENRSCNSPSAQIVAAGGFLCGLSGAVGVQTHQLHLLPWVTMSDTIPNNCEYLCLRMLSAQTVATDGHVRPVRCK